MSRTGIFIIIAIIALPAIWFIAIFNRFARSGNT